MRGQEVASNIPQSDDHLLRKDDRICLKVKVFSPSGAYLAHKLVILLVCWAIHVDLESRGTVGINNRYSGLLFLRYHLLLQIVIVFLQRLKSGFEFANFITDFLDYRSLVWLER